MGNAVAGVDVGKEGKERRAAVSREAGTERGLCVW